MELTDELHARRIEQEPQPERFTLTTINARIDAALHDPKLNLFEVTRLMAQRSKLEEDS